MDTVRAAAVDHLIKHGTPLSSRMHSDPADNFRAAATDALLMRTGVNVENPAQGVEQFRGMSLRDLAIECMARDGQGSTTELLRMGKDDLWNMACRQFFNPTSAFPAILDNTIRKTIEDPVSDALVDGRLDGREVTLELADHDGSAVLDI